MEKGLGVGVVTCSCVKEDGVLKTVRSIFGLRRGRNLEW